MRVGCGKNNFPDLLFTALVIFLIKKYFNNFYQKLIIINKFLEKFKEINYLIMKLQN